MVMVLTDKSNPDMRIVLLLQWEHHVEQFMLLVLARPVRNVQRQKLHSAWVQTDPRPTTRQLGAGERLLRPCPPLSFSLSPARFTRQSVPSGMRHHRVISSPKY